MKECKNLEKCSFVKACASLNKDKAVKGFVSMYCKGRRQEDCIRLQLCNAYGKEIVPSNMMPTGYPLPGTNREGWAVEAEKFNKFLKK